MPTPKNTFYYFSAALSVFLIYPLAVSLVILTDTVFGDAEFLRYFLFESKKGTLLILLNDWLHALPWCAAVWAAVLLSTSHYPNFRVNTFLIVLATLLLIGALSPWHLPLILSTLLISTAIVNSAFSYLASRGSRS